MTQAETYAHWVLAPENYRDTGRLIKMAAQRFLDDLKREDIYFDPVEACRIPDMIEANCCQWEGDWEGVPLKFEPWQRFHLEQMYGWIRKETGTRRFDEVFIQISKKNGKSTESAGIMIGHVFFDRINTPKVFTAANNEEQAKIAVNMAGRIVKASEAFEGMMQEDLIGLMTYKENITEVINYENNGFIKAFSKETSDKKSKTAGGKHGVNASLGVVDEFGMSPDHGASKAIKTSMASRKERLMFYITTAGFNMDGPCYRELRDVGIKVLEGTVQKDNYLPIIYEIDPPIVDGKPTEITMQWLKDNEWAWKQSNPNLDVSVHRDFLRSMVDDAVTYGGTTEVDVKTLNFNIWCDSPSVFIAADIWNKNTHGITEEDLLGRECYGGIEIVGGKYLNAFALLFPDVKGKTVVKPIFWMPDEYRKSRDTDQLDGWVKSGLIHVDLGNVFDNHKAFDIIDREIRKYQMHSFEFRNNMENNDIVQMLIKAGYEGNGVSHGIQGVSNPTLIWEDSFTGFHMEHFGNPVLAWMNSNCMAVRKNGDVRIEKSGSRVVGIYACINALSRWKSVDAGNSDDQVIESW